MISDSSIEHRGIIRQISKDRAEVSIITKGACASCHIQGSCNPSEMQEKIIEVELLEANFSVGDQVCVFLQEREGVKALFWAYLLPFLLLIFLIFTVSYITSDELIIGLGSLSILPFYYFVLFLLKERIKKQFHFTLK
jgi:sigma-E factor negative regulatory protein RseC